MSSSSKSGGSGSKSYDYYTRAVCIELGHGPLFAIDAILEDGKNILDGPVLRGTSVGPDLITIAGRGSLYIYWGTDTQAASPVLATFEAHPPYKNRARIEARNFLLGRERTSAPNWVVHLRRAPSTKLVTGAAATLDDDNQANVVAFGDEIFTSPVCLGLPTTRFDIPSWQAQADAINTAAQRALFAVSPCITSQVSVGSLLEQLWGLPGLFPRLNADRKIELKRWLPPSDTSGLPIITAIDLYEEPSFDSSAIEDLPTDYTCDFTDRDRLFKDTPIKVPDLAGLAAEEMSGRILVNRRVENISSPEVVRRAQAKSRVQEYQRIRRGGSLDGKCRVMRKKGLAINPGDYFFIDDDPIPDGSASLCLVRCLNQTFGPAGPVDLTFQSEPNAAPVPYTLPSTSTIPGIPEPLQPAFWCRPISLRPLSGDDPCITALIARPSNQVIGVDVLYDSNVSTGTFPTIGTISGFAQPCKLELAATAASSTVRIRTLVYPTAWSESDVDRWLLADGIGVGETEAADDRMLVVLLKKNAATGELIATSSGKWVEIMSIRAISMVSADVWDVSVLRGRLGTQALDFNTGSFPDDFYEYEAWVIPGSSLERFYHTDFLTNLKNGSIGVFRFLPFSKSQVYNPADAYAAGKQFWTGWNNYGFIWPVGDLTPAVSGVGYSGISILNANLVNTLPTPSVDPASQTFSSTLSVTVLGATGDVIRFSTAGDVTGNSQEWPKSGGVYTAMTISTTTVLKVRSFNGTAMSDEIILNYTKSVTTAKVATPAITNMTFGPNYVDVTLGCATSGATIQRRSKTVVGAWSSWSTSGTIRLFNRSSLEAYATKATVDQSDLLEFTWEYDAGAYNQL